MNYFNSLQSDQDFCVPKLYIPLLDRNSNHICPYIESRLQLYQLANLYLFQAFYDMDAKMKLSGVFASAHKTKG